MAKKKTPAVRARLGRPPKSRNGPAKPATVYFPGDTLVGLRKFAGYQTSLGEKIVSLSDIVVAAVDAFAPFQTFLRLRKK
jgi:hypothetical protein